MTKFRHLISFCTIAVPLWLSSPVAATRASEPHENILHAAEVFLLANGHRFDAPPEVARGDLDSRLRLPKCSQPIKAFEPANGLKGGKTIVGVQCPGSKPWKIYVPMYVRLPLEVVVASRPIHRGKNITLQDVKLARQDLAGLHRDYFQRVSDIVGLRAKRSIKTGTVITPPAVAANRLIKRGAEVTILSANPTLQVRVRGKAMGHGKRGDRIKVKNLNSGRVVSATVVDNGLVRVLD